MLFLRQMYKKRIGGLRFLAQSEKKNKKKNKVAAFKGLITSRWSGNELMLLPRTKRE